MNQFKFGLMMVCVALIATAYAVISCVVAKRLDATPDEERGTLLKLVAMKQPWLTELVVSFVKVMGKIFIFIFTFYTGVWLIGSVASCAAKLISILL